MTDTKTRHLNQIAQREHDETAVAKRVVTVSKGGRTLSYEATTTGNAAASLHMVESDLGRVATMGYVVCDGNGNITVDFSDDGTNYGGEHTLRAGESLNFDGLNISILRITPSASNSSYRILVS